MDLFSLLLTNLVSAMGITVVVSILSIVGDIYGVDQSSAMWLMTGFMLTYASFMPIFGRLSDRFGRKRIFIVANLVFSAGLILSAVSRNFYLVVLGRALQGFGSGGILPVANAMVVEMMPKKGERGLALVNMTYGLGMIAGVNFGGILYENLGVSSIFYIPAILSIVMTLFSAIFLKETLKEKKKFKIDVLGSILFASVMVFFILAMEYAGAGERIYLLHAAISASLLVLFVIRELGVDEPAVDLKLFKNPIFTIYNILAMLFGISMFISVTFMAPFVQMLFGFNVSESVYAIDPFALVMALSIALSGYISRRFGPYIATSIGAGVLTISLFLFSRYADSIPSFFVLSFLVGVGLGLSMTPMNQIVMEEGGLKMKGLSAGLVSVMRSVGGVVGPTLAGFVFSRTDFSSIFALDNIIQAYRRIYSMAGWAALSMFILSVSGIVLKRSRKEVLEYES